jgi:ferredoxin
MKKLIVDRDICEGHAVCLGIAPGVFDLDAENKAVVKDPGGEEEQTILDAINACPVQAISWSEEQSE